MIRRSSAESGRCITVSRFGASRFGATVSVTLLFSAPVCAETWDMKPFITTAVTLTDNVEFETDANSAAAFTVAPGVIVTRHSMRTNLDLSLSLLGDYDTYNQEFNGSVDASGAATLGTELADDFLFLDAKALITQEVIDPSRGASEREFERGGNIGTIQSYTVSPYALYRFGGLARSETRARFGLLLAESASDDAYDYEFSETISSGPQFTRNLWEGLLKYGVTQQFGDTDEVNPVGGSTALAERERTRNILGRANLEHVLNQHWSLTGSIGYEDISSSAIQEDLSGPIWSVGFIYRLPQRLTATVSYGQRYERENYFLDLTYNPTSRTRLTARYERVPETQQQRFLRDNAFVGVAPDGRLIDTRTGLPFDERERLLGLTNEFLLRDDYTLSARFDRGRNTYNAELYYSKAQSVETDFSEDGYGASVGWTRQLTPLALANLSFRYETTSTEDEGSENRYLARLSGSWQLSPTLTASLNYSFQYLDRSRSLGDIRENAITFALTKAF